MPPAPRSGVQVVRRTCHCGSADDAVVHATLVAEERIRQCDGCQRRRVFRTGLQGGRVRRCANVSGTRAAVQDRELSSRAPQIGTRVACCHLEFILYIEGNIGSTFNTYLWTVAIKQPTPGSVLPGFWWQLVDTSQVLDATRSVRTYVRTYNPTVSTPSTSNDVNTNATTTREGHEESPLPRDVHVEVQVQDVLQWVMTNTVGESEHRLLL